MTPLMNDVLNYMSLEQTQFSRDRFINTEKITLAYFRKDIAHHLKIIAHASKSK